MPLDVRAYWEHRLGGPSDAEAVGHAGLGAGLNAWMMRVRRAVFLREVRPLAASISSVLDVGSGTGVNIDRWRELGVAEIVGSDIAQVAVDRLAGRFPSVEFVRFQLGSEMPEALRGRRFDAISAMEVLFHVLEDDAYERAFATLYDLLVPGGLLVFSENFLHGRELRSAHQRSRTVDEIERVVRATGFEVLRRRPLFFLLNAPHDSRSRVHRLWWRGLVAIASRSDRAGGALGALLYRAELAIVTRLHEGPSTELMLCRRAG